MSQWNSVAIVGVGLIGGSIGRALLKRDLAREVVGIGRRAVSLRAARKVGAATRTTTSLERGVADAELTIICTPVGDIARHARAVAQACPEGALVTDAGSTKAQIVAALDGSLPHGVRFVGSHPLAGSEKRGPESACAELFVGRVTVLTPGPATRPADTRRIARFWRSLGSTVVEMPPDEHDAALAATSHLPHLVASALAAATPAELLQLTAGGWRDTTRIAAGDPEMWRQIFASNRASVLAAMQAFESQWQALRAALSTGDDQRLVALLKAACQRRQSLESRRKENA